MAVNFESYKVFYYVARYQNITLAANALFLSQPTVSRSIQNLEQALGCTLFRRSKRGVVLTPEGKLLYEHAKPACEHLFLAEEELDKRHRLESGQIRIGASEMTLNYYLLPYLEAYRRSFPQIKMMISTFTTFTALQALKAGRIDAAVISSPIVKPEGLEVRILTDFRDIIIAGNDFLHLKGRTVTFEECLSHPVICMGENTTSRRYLEDFFAEHGLQLRTDIEITTITHVVPLAMHNLGIGFIAPEFAADALAKERIFQLQTPQELPLRHICLITDKQRPLSAACAKFTESLDTLGNIKTESEEID